MRFSLLLVLVSFPLFVACGKTYDDEGREVAPLGPATTKLMQGMLKISPGLVTMWNTSFQDLPRDASFETKEVAASMKHFYLEQVREDLEAGEVVVDTSYSADFPEDFRDFKYVRAVMIHPENHRYSGFHVVLANEAACRSWGEDFEEGSIIIKLIYPAMEDSIDNLFQGDMEAMFVFQKDTERYGTDFGGWGFEVMDFYNGTRLVTGWNHAKWCYSCHSQARNDIVYSPDPAELLELPETEPMPLIYSPFQDARISNIP